MTARWNLTGNQRKNCLLSHCESLKLTFCIFYLQTGLSVIKDRCTTNSVIEIMLQEFHEWERTLDFSSWFEYLMWWSNYKKSENLIFFLCVMASSCGQFWLHFKRMINLFSMPNFSCPITKYSNIYFKTSSISWMWIIPKSDIFVDSR